MAAGKNRNDKPSIIRKKRKGGGHGAHHGGAWKVAYADFVTAMMAFFLLLWILNAVQEETLEGLADYFTPTWSVSANVSGAGDVLGGQSVEVEGPRPSPDAPTDLLSVTKNEVKTEAEKEKKEKTPEEKSDAAKTEMDAAEQKQFEDAADALRKAIVSNPELQHLGRNLIVDMTDEGMRIQIVDQDGKSMFPTGSAVMYPETEKLVQVAAEAIKSLPNGISLRGHTDAAPYSRSGYDNWNLSADRAIALRRILIQHGVVPNHIRDVVGKSDTDHLFEKTPLDPRNRRVSIILLRQAVEASDRKRAGEHPGEATPDRGTKRPIRNGSGADFIPNW